MTVSVRIQTVIYHHPRTQVALWLEAVGTAVAHARRTGVIGGVEVAIGDSATPSLDPGAIPGMAARAEGNGVGPLDYVAFGANLGSAGGHNRLFGLSRGAELVLVLNPDALLSPRCLTGLVQAMEDPGVGIAEARHIPLEHPKAYDPVTGETSWATGTCCLIRQEVLTATGGFDPDTFFLYGDDVDLSWRTRLAGWRIRHVPWAVVCHDKRLDPNGRQRATEVEERYAAEVALLLPWKYGRPDLIEERERRFLATGMATHRAGVHAFYERQATGRLPSPVPGCENVAHFMGNAYGFHRFAYPRTAEVH